MSIEKVMSHQVEELSWSAMSHQIEELSAEELDAVSGASGGYHYGPNTPPNPPPSVTQYQTTSPNDPGTFIPPHPSLTIPRSPVPFPGNSITFIG